MKKGLAGLVLGCFLTAGAALPADAKNPVKIVIKENVSVPKPENPKDISIKGFQSGNFLGLEIKVSQLTYCAGAINRRLYEIWDKSTNTLYVAGDYEIYDETMNLARFTYAALLLQLGANIVYLDEKESSRQQALFYDYQAEFRAENIWKKKQDNKDIKESIKP